MSSLQLVFALALITSACGDKKKDNAPPASGKDAAATAKSPADKPSAAVPDLDLAPVGDAEMKKARELNQKGLDAQRAKDFEAAIGHYEAALSVDPGHIIARYNLATAHALAGNKDEALAGLEELAAAAADCQVCAGRLARAKVDDDFKALREDAKFKQLTEGVKIPSLDLEGASKQVLAALIATTPNKAASVPHLHPRNAVAIELTAGQCDPDDGDDCETKQTVHGSGKVGEIVADWFVLEAAINTCKKSCCAVKTTGQPEGDSAFQLNEICAEKDSGGVWAVTRLVGIEGP